MKALLHQPETHLLREKRNALKILMIADPFLPVPPVYYGGTERGVNLQCEWLAKRAYRVHLIAGPGSKDYGGGLTVHRAPSPAYYSRVYRKLLFQFIVLRAAMGADVIVNHGRVDYLDVIYRTKKPVIHWFHNPLTGREVSYILRRRRRGDHFVGLSRSHVAEDREAARFHVVHNARDIDSIPFCPDPATPPYVAFLGRLTRDKGVHLAIEVARRAGIKLLIGGNIPNEPGAADYFAAEVKPHLGPGCEWIGPYDNMTRAKILPKATALLFPIKWNEPFGSVMIEALAGGVPVIASRLASASEVIMHGKTGFLCDSVEDMVTAIHRIKEISRRACRADAEERFSEAPYIRQLEQLLDHVALHSRD
jgi:glycosyltransferase involved in cell wall biosynthesis